MKSDNYNRILNHTKEVTTICNNLEKEILIKSVKDKGLIGIKDNINKLKYLIVDILKDIKDIHNIDLSIAILYENNTYLGILNSKYIVYKKNIDNDITILNTSTDLKQSLKNFYYYAYYKKRCRNNKKNNIYYNLSKKNK